MSSAKFPGAKFQRVDLVIRRVIQQLARVVVCVSGLLIIALVCGQVLGRVLFDTQVLGLAELSVLAVPWLWFFGAVLAANSGFYVVGGLPFRNPVIKQAVTIGSAVVGLLVSGTFGYFLYDYCEWTVTRDVRSVALSVPRIWSASGAFAAMVMIFLISGLELIKATIGTQESE